MTSIIRFLMVLTPITSRLGLCGDVGFIVGALVGFIVANAAWIHPGVTMGNELAAKVALITAAFAWIAVLLLLRVTAKFTLRSMAGPTLVNSVLSAFATVFVSKWLAAYTFAWLIGMVVGALVGMLLCRLNQFFTRA